MSRNEEESYFYPRSPCGERLPSNGTLRSTHKNFYPRSPCGERQRDKLQNGRNSHFYPRSPCGERRQVPHNWNQGLYISIHALLAESDSSKIISSSIKVYFYPRSPCGERPAEIAKTSNADTFLSTLSLRRATCKLSWDNREIEFLSTLSLRRATVMHALEFANFVLFLSTLSLRRATLMWYQCNTVVKISIHALLAESDLIFAARHMTVRIFLSTLSLRRATSQCRTFASGIYDFYPRSPCGERPFSPSGRMTRPYFYPRSPCGERPRIIDPTFGKEVFLSTLSLRRATTSAN